MNYIYGFFICLLLVSCKEAEKKEIVFIKSFKNGKAVNSKDIKPLDTISLPFAKYSNDWNSFFNLLLGNDYDEKEKIAPRKIKQLSKNVVESKFYIDDGDYYVYSVDDFGPIYIVRTDFGPIEYKIFRYPDCEKDQIERMISLCDSLHTSIGGIPKVVVPK